MARPRVETTRLQELIRLHRMGASARHVVRVLRMSPKTERRYRHVLDSAGLLAGPRHELPQLQAIRAAVTAALPLPAQAPSSVGDWQDTVQGLVDKGLEPRAVFDRLRVEAEFTGSYSAVKRFVRRLRCEEGAAADDVAVVIPTSPGEEAQVDFGYAGKLYDPDSGRVRRAWVFVMLLCHSRHMFVRLVFDQRTETWLDLHERAFRFFGGVVASVVPDNTKRAVLRAAFGIDGPTDLERSYRELAKRYDFKIDPAPPGDPRKRGKVEATVKYLRNNPLKGRDGESIEDVERVLQRWNLEVAAQRIHGTTGLRPIEAFAGERAALRPLPPAAAPVIWKQARVHSDAHVACRGRLFSVPWQLLHEHVWVRFAGDVVEVFHRDQRVASHAATGPRRSTQEAHLPADRRQFRHRSEGYWKKRADAIGPDTRAFVDALFARDEVLSFLRTVQAVVKHLEGFPARRAELASARALRVEDFTYQGIKQALADGLDLREVAKPARPPKKPVRCTCGAVP